MLIIKNFKGFNTIKYKLTSCFSYTKDCDNSPGPGMLQDLKENVDIMFKIDLEIVVVPNPGVEDVLVWS